MIIPAAHAAVDFSASYSDPSGDVRAFDGGTDRGAASAPGLDITSVASAVAGSEVSVTIAFAGAPEDLAHYDVRAIIGPDAERDLLTLSDGAEDGKGTGLVRKEGQPQRFDVGLTTSGSSMIFTFDASAVPAGAPCFILVKASALRIDDVASNRNTRDVAENPNPGTCVATRDDSAPSEKDAPLAAAALPLLAIALALALRRVKNG